ncbi:ImmA/IrrE family metallo-endopeptidase [Lysinibacillus cavernae]|uniref:ImmA/IrrE family metallo-endopeptidase n=1 Tax=Lysinibacillus cavernae TaxID=2666135 RepID=UPI003B75BCB0
MDPILLNFEEIAFRMGLKFFYWSDKSQALFINGRHYIFLNENQSPQQQWQDFCHELSHVLLHTGNQFHMYPLFREYQEFKADNFMYNCCFEIKFEQKYLANPYFMINKKNPF